MFSHSILWFCNIGGSGCKLFYYNLSGSQQLLALKTSTLSPPAFRIAINGYIHEYPDDAWSEALVSKNALPLCSGNSSQVSAPSPIRTRSQESIWRSPGNCGLPHSCLQGSDPPTGPALRTVPTSTVKEQRQKAATLNSCMTVLAFSGGGRGGCLFL